MTETTANKKIRLVEVSRFSDHACVERFNQDIAAWCRDEGGRYVIFRFSDLAMALSPQVGAGRLHAQDPH